HRSHSSSCRGQGGGRCPGSASRRLDENKRKLSVRPANCFECRERRLDIRLTRSRWNETKVSRPNGIGYKVVVAARRIDDRQRAAPPLEASQGALKLEPVGDPLDDWFWVSSTRRPVRDRALPIGLQHEHPLAILHGRDRHTDA